MDKTLILIRHSKTEVRTNSGSDFERILTDEGKEDSLKMGKILLDSGITPDLILTSSAARAFETASIIGGVLNTSKDKIISTRKLYYSPSKAILDQIYGLPESIHCVLVVTHNPGISDLTRGLSAGMAFYLENTQCSLFKYRMKHWFQIDETTPEEFRILKVTDKSLGK